ncbi:MAG: hypothetical protein B7Z16_15405 [Algoriphagus sp. 32-45-6]|nr:MAG: hypothetical protein B7Z16_15405 [Algoriphagus sp. 32-45-6]
MYEDPAYAEIKAELHRKLDGLREKYGDSKELSQQYLDKYLDRLEETQQFGAANKAVTKQILENRRKSD